MSHNPYSTPMQGGNQQNPSGYGLPVERPGYASAICVIYLILGGLGIVTSCLGVISVVFVLAMQNNADFQKALAAQGEVDSVSMLVNGVFVVLNLFVATGLILYAIFGLQNKEAGRKGLILVSFVAGAFVILRMIVSSVVLFVRPPAIPPNLDEMERGMVQAFQMGGLALGVVIALVLAGFYFFNASYLQRDNVVSFYAQSERRLSR